MKQTDHPADALPELRELNRLFLSMLRARLVRGESCEELPSPATAVLAGATDEVVDRLAAYPQALFQIVLDREPAADRSAANPRGTPPGRVEDGRPVDADATLTVPMLMLLVSARHLSRQHPYAARLYLRLSPGQQHALGALAIADLPALARRDGIVRCAYGETTWMWQRLVAARQPHRTRSLVLLGLQPRIELNAPLSMTP